jgi:hypothetical protein
LQVGCTDTVQPISNLKEHTPASLAVGSVIEEIKNSGLLEKDVKG